MAQFLTTHGTAFQIENIIAQAKRRLVLVTPYLQLSRTLYERLRDAGGRGVRITLAYGKSQLSSDEQQALSELRGLSLYYSENLHAKCYFNEDQMVITSMNLYEFSEKNNREMGVLVTRAEEVYASAEGEVQSILAAAEPQTLGIRPHVREAHRVSPQRVGAQRVTTHRVSPQGSIAVRRSGRSSRRGDAFCIRCTRAIRYDPDTPYCDRCLDVWSAFENPDYIERVCHSCRRETRSTMSRPLCYSCYREASG